MNAPKKIYQLGDPARVILIRVSPEERNIDFVLEDNSSWIEGGDNTRLMGPSTQSKTNNTKSVSIQHKKPLPGAKNTVQKPSAKKSKTRRSKPKKKK